MTRTTAGLLARIHAAGGHLEVRGDLLRWRAPTPLPAELLDALREQKTEILAALHAQNPAGLLRSRILSAGDWQELYAILIETDMAYVDGEVTGDDVDSLCDMARQSSRTLPERKSPARTA
jgi:hypothetical protein